VSRRAPAKRSEVGGTRLIEAAILSRVTKYVTNTIEVSRYRLTKEPGIYPGVLF